LSLRWRRAVLAGAALLVAGSALAYVRATGEKGLCLWWGKRQIPYAVNDFSVNGASQVCGSGGDVFLAAQRGFAAWTPAGAATCTDLQMQYQGSSSTDTGNDGQNLVVFRRGPCSAMVPAGDPCLAAHTCGDQFNCWDTSDSGHADPRIIALTTTSYRVSTGEILDADLELNAWNPPAGSGYYFTCLDPGGVVRIPCSNNGDPNCIDTDVQNTVTHEAGHFLGLAHSADPQTTMYFQSGSGDVSKRTLSPDDVAGICAIYPAGKPTVNCVPKGGGCGHGPAGREGLLALLALFLARARARTRARDP
jgi:hypothetical protein